MARTPNIPKDVKEEAIRRMLPPNSESPKVVAEELGINYDTIRHLKSKAKAKTSSSREEKVMRFSLTSADKFQIVLETAAMTEVELGEYARQRGLYVEEIKSWKEACMNANGGTNANEQHLSQELKATQQENKSLKKELQRKDHALAEAAALLVLSKKANAIWGEAEDE